MLRQARIAILLLSSDPQTVRAIIGLIGLIFVVTFGAMEGQSAIEAARP